MRVTVGACLMALCLVVASQASAGKVAKVDLTAYLDGHPQVGDFRVYDRDDGATVRTDVVQAADLKKSTLFASQYTEDGNVETDIGELVHGREFRIGSVFVGQDIDLDLPKPKRVESFLFAPGVPQKFRVAFKILFQGQRAGKATLTGATTFVGFVQVIPAFDPAAVGTLPVAQFHRDQTLTLKVGKTVFTTTSTSDTWVTLDHGTVRREYASQSFQDGVPTSTFGPHVYTLDHGEEGGVPFP